MCCHRICIAIVAQPTMRHKGGRTPTKGQWGASGGKGAVRDGCSVGRWRVRITRQTATEMFIYLFFIFLPHASWVASATATLTALLALLAPPRAASLAASCMRCIFQSLLKNCAASSSSNNNVSSWVLCAHFEVSYWTLDFGLGA